MNKQQADLWKQLRSAYRPATPELDTAAILEAVRREAAAHPLRRAEARPVGAIPTWLCATAASLALLAAASVLFQSVELADQQIGLAWMHSVEPDQFAETFIPFGESSL